MAVVSEGRGVTLKSDGERSITALKNGIAAARDAPTVPVETPARESKSNGAMEVRVKSWQAQFRTMLFDLQNCVQAVIPLGNRIISWLVKWAATVLNKYKLDAAGRTASQRVTGGGHKKPIAKFGEHIMWMPNGKRDPGMKAESNMHDGVFLGLRNLSTEAIISTRDGIVYARTIRRKPEDERWSKDLVMGVKQSFDDSLGGHEPTVAGGGSGIWAW